MEVITVLSRKGGTGKSTSAAALGAGLRRRGYRVLFVDLDSQANLTYTLGADAGGGSCMDLFTKRATIGTVLQHTNQGDVLPAGPDLATADTVLTATGKEYVLREVLEPLKDSYDYVIVDTAAQLGVLTIAALTAADRAIITAGADLFSLQGMDLIADAAAAVRRYTNSKLQIDGLLLTRYNGRAVLARNMKDALDTMARQLGTRLYRTTIRQCTALQEAATMQQDIFDYAPRSNGAKDYDAFINEFLNEREV